MRVRTRIIRPEPFRVIVADPPWKFGDKLDHKRRGAATKYKTLTVKQIMEFELPPLAEDCVLFLWRVSAMQQEALDVARAWGFNPTKGEIVWRKMTPRGKEHFGMGYIVRGSHESCLIATRGNPPKAKSRSIRSLFSAPVPRDGNKKIEHSAKPDEFFRIVRALYDGPRVSLFERSFREGFVCIGDQMPRAA